MKNYLVSLLNEDGTVREQRNFVKSKDIARSLDIDYHAIRAVLKYQELPEAERPSRSYKTSKLMSKLKIEIIDNNVPQNILTFK